MCYTVIMIEIPKDIKTILKTIGLDMAEQQVIFYLFKSGLSTIADIASGVKLPRSTVHVATENLLDRRVLGVTKLGKRRMMYIENPEKIKNFVEYEKTITMQKMESLESVFPELRTFFALRGETEQIDVEHLEGEDGFIDLFFRSLDQDKNGEVLRISGDIEKFTVAKDRMHGYGKARRKKGIAARNIITESPMAKDELKESRLKLRDTRIISKKILNPNLHCSIWKNHVTFTIWDQGLHSIVITNKSIYEFAKMIFETLWIQAK